MKRKRASKGTRRVSSQGCVGRAKWPIVIEKRLAGCGPTEIANELGVRLQPVLRTLAHPEVVAAMEAEAERRAGNARRLARASLDRAVQTLISRLDAEDDADAIRAAVSLLDRAGMGQKQEVANTHAAPDGGPVRTLDLTGKTQAEILEILAAIRKARGGDSGDAG